MTRKNKRYVYMEENDNWIPESDYWIAEKYCWIVEKDTWRYLWVTVALSCLLFLPFIGLSDFNTKGESREAVVALSMLDSGNWVLPENNGGDIAYKPPMFHWAVAYFSVPVEGVNEYTSRLPSALALIVMVVACYCFYARRRGAAVALLTAIITMTNFEVHRAAGNCRVDMVLTLFIVLALLSLFRWTERWLFGFPYLATVFMGLATLTKGPVGILLPCMVTAVYLWVRGWGFWMVAWRLALVALVSCVLPVCWYVAAYWQGGDAFLYLVYEENVLRFIGKMPYGSHENPWPYNVLTVVAGYAPYTLLALLAGLFSLRRFSWKGKFFLKGWNPLMRLRQMDGTQLFSLLSIVLIFVFYCIPKSKRSVYLLPIYPFIAYFLAEWILRLLKSDRRPLRVYSGVLAGVGALLLACVAAVRAGFVPANLFHGKHAAENAAYLEALHSVPLSWLAGISLVFLLVAVGVAIVRPWWSRGPLPCALAVTFGIYFVLDSFVLPTVLNVKSDKPVAVRVGDIAGRERVYSYVGTDMLHFFTINFYRRNSIVPFESVHPESGYLLVGEKDASKFLPAHSDYVFEKVYDSGHRSCDTRQKVQLYSFRKKSAPVREERRRYSYDHDDWCLSPDAWRGYR